MAATSPEAAQIKVCSKCNQSYIFETECPACNGKIKEKTECLLSSIHIKNMMDHLDLGLLYSSDIDDLKQLEKLGLYNPGKDLVSRYGILPAGTINNLFIHN